MRFSPSLSFDLALTNIAIALGYVLIQHSLFADTSVPLNQNAVMQAMTELIGRTDAP